MVPWKVLCDGLKDEGQKRVGIRIELLNGLTVSGHIDVADARKIFRDPRDLPSTKDPAGEVVVVLPASKVARMVFPAND